MSAPWSSALADVAYTMMSIKYRICLGRLSPKFLAPSVRRTDTWPRQDCVAISGRYRVGTLPHRPPQVTPAMPKADRAGGVCWRRTTLSADHGRNRFVRRYPFVQNFDTVPSAPDHNRHPFGHIHLQDTARADPHICGLDRIKPDDHIAQQLQMLTMRLQCRGWRKYKEHRMPTAVDQMMV